MPPEVILAFDTSAAHCAAALLCDGQVVADAFLAMEKGQAERLMPMLEHLLAGATLTWSDLTHIAVGTGPGNFTGVRIAVAAARGLALGLGIPAVGVTRLEALAYGLPRPVMVVEDARRGEIYAQEFRRDLPEQAELTEISDVGIGINAEMAFVGSAAVAVTASWGGDPVLPRYPLTHAIAHIAASRTTPQPRPAPFYLRAADAAPSAIQPPVIL